MIFQSKIGQLPITTQRARIDEQVWKLEIRFQRSEVAVCLLYFGLFFYFSMCGMYR